FLHVEWQPAWSVRGAHLDLSALAVAALVIAALVDGLRRGFAPLRAGLPIWLATVAFLAVILVSLLRASGERRGAHLISAGRFAEYTLLAPAVPLLLRRRGELRVALAVLISCSVAATGVGLLQFAGVPIAGAWTPGLRQPSFVGIPDFAALS